MTKAQEFLAFVSKAATNAFKANGGLMPILHMEDEFGNHIHIHFAGMQESTKSKDAMSDIMRKAIKQANAQRYAFVTEAWMVDEGGDHKSAAEMQERGQSLEFHPDRIEAITIFVEDKNTKENLTRMYRILRPEHGKPTLAPPRDIDGVENQGRFANLFAD